MVVEAKWCVYLFLLGLGLLIAGDNSPVKVVFRNSIRIQTTAAIAMMISSILLSALKICF